MPDTSRELDISIHPEGFGWELWQQQNGKRILLGFWSQLQKEGENQSSPIEKQLLAVSLALQQTEDLTTDLPVSLRTPLPVGRWIKDFLLKSKSACA